MLITKDNINKISEIHQVNRIVSLVPSLTETIAFIGSKNILSGVTRFCKYPAGIRQETTVVGGPKDFDTEKILRLKPDVVVAVREENDKERILQLSEKIPVVLFDILHLTDAYEMMHTLGKLLGKEKEAKRIVTEIKNNLNPLPTGKPRTKCLYLIWKDPWMAAGQETFINEMLQRAGFENVAEGRYPKVSDEVFLQAKVLLLSSEPFPFREKHRQELQKKFPGKKVLPVDGEMFSWYGIRMAKAGNYLREIMEVLQ